MIKSAVYDEARKIFTAFFTWGLGLVMMTVYCLFVYWLNLRFGKFVMIAGALVFLAASFFGIDLWWRVQRARKINRQTKDADGSNCYFPRA